jgi:hypothetical protein
MWPKCAVPESLDELKARCVLLREMGVAHHDPSSGALSFFPPVRALAPVSEQESVEVKRLRDEAADRAMNRVRYGAAGGLQPGQVPVSEVARRTQEEREEQKRIARQNEKARAARAKLDAA